MIPKHSHRSHREGQCVIKWSWARYILDFAIWLVWLLFFLKHDAQDDAFPVQAIIYHWSINARPWTKNILSRDYKSWLYKNDTVQVERAQEAMQLKSRKITLIT